MKSLFLLLIFGSQVLQGYSSVWTNSTHRASKTILAGVKFSLKYPVLPWEKLASRRSAAERAIIDLRTMGKYHTSDPYANLVIDNDVGARLYTILDNVVAVHSSLPRIGPVIDLSEGTEKYTEIKRFSDLEDTFVPREVWGQYRGWGMMLKQELEKALNTLPDSLSLNENDQEEVFRFLADEFDRDGYRVVYSDAKGSQHGAGHDSYIVKKDLPALSVSWFMQPPGVSPTKVPFRDRWPSKSGFLATLKSKSTLKKAEKSPE